MRRLARAALVFYSHKIIFVHREECVSLGSGVNEREIEARRVRKGGGVKLAAADNKNFISAVRARRNGARVLKRIGHGGAGRFIVALPCYDDIGAPRERAIFLGQRLPRLAPHNDRMSGRKRLKSPHILGDMPQELPAPPELPILPDGGDKTDEHTDSHDFFFFLISLSAHNFGSITVGPHDFFSCWISREAWYLPAFV